MATTIRGKWSGEGNRIRYYDSANNNETVKVIADVFFSDDFLGKAFDVTNWWTALDVSAAGLTTPVLVADGASGLLSLPLDATSEVQLSGVTWGDHRPLILNQGLVFEARLALSVLPTGAVVFCAGLCGDHNAAVNTVAESIWFRADGSGAITVETDDTVNETSVIATGVTLTAGLFAVLKIDCSDITSVKFYINGSQVAAGTTFNMSQVAALKLQPVVRIGKEAAATTVGTVQLDYIRAWQNRA
jgi:hypothetical protein